MTYQTKNPLKFAFRTLRWELSKFWLALHPHVAIIGITGSVGKTTTKEALAKILSDTFPTLKTAENFDPIFNIPQTLLKIRGAEKIVLEMGVDGFGQMEKYLSLVTPRIGIVTRFSLAHTDKDHFGSLKGLIKEKSQLIASLSANGWAILNGDDPEVIKLKQHTRASVLLYGYGHHNDLQIKNYSQISEGKLAHSSFDLSFDSKTMHLKTKLLGKQNALCLAAAFAVGLKLGIKPANIIKSIWAIDPVPQRLNVKRSLWHGFIIDDTYNASPEAVKAAIDVLVDFHDKQAFLVLGQMKELGKFTRKSHFEVGQYAREKGISNLLAIGENAQDLLAGFRGGEHFKHPKDIIAKLRSSKPKTILVKGSRGMAMEKIVSEITLV